MSKIILESLFPEVANLYGDNGNMRYLKLCIPDAETVIDRLNEEPYFVKNTPSFIAMSPMSERAQELVIARLFPYRERIAELIEIGCIFLMTGNAMEIFFDEIQNEDGTSIKGLGIFHYVAKRKMFDRYNRHCMGDFGDIRIVGYKNQFTHAYGDNSKEFFLSVTKGDGINRESQLEGIKRNNFFGTYLLGPILIQNPKFTRYILSLLDRSDVSLPFEETIMAAYERRREEYEEMEFGLYS